MQTTLTEVENGSDESADDCTCDDLPDGVPCADCFIYDGLNFEVKP